MRFVCFFAGKPKKPHFKEAISDYELKIRRFAELSVIYLKQTDRIVGLQDYLSRRTKFKSYYHVILDVNGKEFTSEEFADFIRQHPDTTWLIGGPDGVSSSVKEQADLLLSFGKMTFPHELAQVMLLEQIFRALTIINRFPYHK